MLNFWSDILPYFVNTSREGSDALNLDCLPMLKAAKICAGSNILFKSFVLNSNLLFFCVQDLILMVNRSAIFVRLGTCY